MRVETKQDVIDTIKNNLDNFAKYGVSEVGLFRSFVREEQTDKSDVDLLVNLQLGLDQQFSRSDRFCRVFVWSFGRHNYRRSDYSSQWAGYLP